MLRIISTLFFTGCWLCISAQHQVGISSGYTLSKVRALFPIDHQPSFIDKDFTEFSFCHTPYFGIFYQYRHKKIILQTGLNSMIIGAGNQPWSEPDETHPWYHYYLTAPLLVGYQLPINRRWRLNFHGGLELGLQWGQPFITVYGQAKYWGHVGLATAIEVEYKRCRLGIRGLYGLTDFIILHPYRYRHTAMTVYLGYTFYDSHIAQARRLNKTRAVGPRYGAAF